MRPQFNEHSHERLIRDWEHRMIQETSQSESKMPTRWQRGFQIKYVREGFSMKDILQFWADSLCRVKSASDAEKIKAGLDRRLCKQILYLARCYVRRGNLYGTSLTSEYCKVADIPLQSPLIALLGFDDFWLKTTLVVTHNPKSPNPYALTLSLTLRDKS